LIVTWVAAQETPRRKSWRRLRWRRRNSSVPSRT
jgi:hypothetical protein